jgi:hypothetical protein
MLQPSEVPAKFAAVAAIAAIALGDHPVRAQPSAQPNVFVRFQQAEQWWPQLLQPLMCQPSLQAIAYDVMMVKLTCLIHLGEDMAVGPMICAWGCN